MEETTAALRTGQAIDACAGHMCASGQSGHAILSIQKRVASASPGFWRDAIVTAVGTSGVLTLELFADNSVVRVWNHADLEVAIGEPVAWHPVAQSLAVAGSHVSVELL